MKNPLKNLSQTKTLVLIRNGRVQAHNGYIYRKLIDSGSGATEFSKFLRTKMVGNITSYRYKNSSFPRYYTEKYFIA